MELTSDHVNRKGRLPGGSECSGEVPRAREDFEEALRLPCTQELGLQLGPKSFSMRSGAVAACDFCPGESLARSSPRRPCFS